MKGIGAVFCLAVLLCSMVSAPAQAGVEIAPYVAEDGFKDLKLSPTGEYFAATMPMGDRTALGIIRREDRKLVASIAFGQDIHAADFWWVNHERVLIAVAESFGTRDVPQLTGELYGMNVDGSARELLVGWRVRSEHTGTRLRRGGKEELVAAFLIDPLPDDDRHVLISVQPFTADPYTRAEKMDVYTGRRVRVASAPVGRAHFVADHQGVVRFAAGVDTANVGRVYYRPSAASEWELLNDERISGRGEWPLGFSADDSVAYLRVEQPTGPDAIVAMDIASGDRTTAARDATFDPVPIYRDGWSTPIGAEFHGPEPRQVFFDEDSAEARLYRSLAEAFPGNRIFAPSGVAGTESKLVLVSSDVDPGSFYLFDPVAKKADFVLARREAIDPEKMVAMHPVELAARDGLQLHGYLARPHGSDGKRLPMVVLPHGGPFGQFDRRAFHDDTQLLAEAGYAVLRINFRGSGNHGRALRQAGAREWGGKMQDDLTDATRWAVQEGIADPERICIYGASYGAYAALMGVAKEPDLYRCAVGYVGVYDLPMYADDRGNSRWAKSWKGQWVGDDTTALAAVSPNRIAGRIKVPVLLAAGGKDEVTPIEHSRMMERALGNAGVPVETLYFPTEGHGFYTPEHRQEFYVRLLGFLGRHLGGETAAAR